MHPIQISRDHFYELLWIETIKKIAANHGVRPSDIVKAADCAEIPRPPNGYWTQLACGKAFTRPPLPPLGESCSEMIDLGIHKKPYPVGRIKSSSKNTEGQQDQTQDAAGEPRRHKLVLQTERALRGRTPNHNYGLIEPDWRVASFDLRVCKDSIERGLKLLDKLVAAAMSAGFEIVEAKAERSAKFAFRTEHETVPFRIVERVKRKEKAGTSSWERYEYVPTGLLELRFDQIYGATARWKWGDGSTQRIEDLVPNIIEAVTHISRETLRIRTEREEENRLWEKEQQIRHEQELQKNLEDIRQKWLLAEIERWQQSQKMIEFVSAAEQQIGSKAERGTQGKWLDWVRALARSINPLEASQKPWDWWKKHKIQSMNPETAEDLSRYEDLNEWLSEGEEDGGAV